jgi:hypothetical protein
MSLIELVISAGYYEDYIHDVFLMYQNSLSKIMRFRNDKNLQANVKAIVIEEINLGDEILKLYRSEFLTGLSE